MNKSLDVVLSRLKNMLNRISAQDADFEDLCVRHADLTTQIRRLNPMEDPTHAQMDEQLRRRRSNLEQEMFSIMQTNIRV